MSSVPTLASASEYGPYITAAFGLAGTLIGGFVAGFVSLSVARHSREAAERAWVRDNRRDIYDRFLTRAQRLLIACEAHQNTRTPEADAQVDAAHVEFFEVYGVVQTVAEPDVIDAARVYGYRLQELRDERLSRGALPPSAFASVATYVRTARHDTIEAMRRELGLKGSARPEAGFNPFQDTEFQASYAKGMRGGDVEEG